MDKFQLARIGCCLAAGLFSRRLQAPFRVPCPLVRHRTTLSAADLHAAGEVTVDVVMSPALTRGSCGAVAPPTRGPRHVTDPNRGAASAQGPRFQPCKQQAASSK